MLNQPISCLCRDQGRNAHRPWYLVRFLYWQVTCQGVYLVATVPTPSDSDTISTTTGSLRQTTVTLSDLAEHDNLLDAAVDAIVAIDQNGIIIHFNKTAEFMFCHSASVILGKPLHVLLGPEESRNHLDFVKQDQQAGDRRVGGRVCEVVARRSDGTLFPASFSFGEARSPQGPHFIGLIHDLTSQKQAEEEALRQRDHLIHVSRLVTMGEMVAALAHELNQPLSAIATYTAACQRLLMQGNESRDEVLAALKEIGAQAHRSGEVIRRIRDYVRGRAWPHKLLDLGSLIEEIRPLAELYAKENEVQLRIDLDEPLPAINGDRVQLQSVIHNLLRNGVNATADTPVAQRMLRLHVYAISDKLVRVDITDHGHGISDEVRARLFTPFFTTREAGMGMGLAISRSIVNAHGGNIDCYNNPEGGATFFFMLPTAVK